MKYWIVIGCSVPDLIKRVNDAIQDGWSVCGGVALAGMHGEFIQAMTKGVVINTMPAIPEQRPAKVMD